MANQTLAQVILSKNTDTVVGLIEASLSYAPELQVFPTRSIRGTSFLTVKRTGLPTAAFRTANAGIAASKSTFVQAQVSCAILSSAVQVDKAIAQAWEDGSAAYEMIESAGVMQAALRTIGTQIFYGVSADANGFPGLKSLTAFGGAMTVNSGGSDAAVQSSVYAVKFGNQDVQIVLGNEASFDLSPFRDETFLDGNSLLVPGRVADLTAWTGLAVNNANCVGRICNVGADTETNDTLTDAKLASLIEKFPIGYMPDAIFMSRRSRSQLQRARTVTLMGQGKTRADQPAIAPLPSEYDGIPIIATDSIANTDAVES